MVSLSCVQYVASCKPERWVNAYSIFVVTTLAPRRFLFLSQKRFSYYGLT